jgi:O-antigen ligase
MIYIGILSLIAFWNIYILIYFLSPVFIFVFSRELLYNKEKLQSFKLNLIDISVLFVLATEILCYCFSVYQHNSYPFLFKIALLTMFYFFIRYSIEYEWQLKLIITVIAVYASILSFLTIFTFFLFKFNLNNEGFTDVTQYRYLYQPLGLYSNVWATVLLTLLPFQAIIYYYYRNSSIFLILFICIVLHIMAILISFSRGIYISIILFAILCFAWLLYSKIFSIKKVIMNYMIIVFACILSISPLYKQVLSTLSIFNSASHQRSYDGRVKIVKNSLNMVKGFPITGIGTNNFPLKYGYKIDDSYENTFSGTVTNLYLQILIEKGIIGILSYGLLIISIFYISIKKYNLNLKYFLTVFHQCNNYETNKLYYKNINSILNIRDFNFLTTIRFRIFSITVFTCCLIAICLREMTYSSFFINDNFLFLLFFILIFISYEPNTDHSLEKVSN